MRGGYLLFLEFKEPKTLAIGSLGKHAFPAGLYAYAGSALGGIERRVGRHFSKSKKKRWHIDHLTDKAEPLDYIAIESEQRIDCDLVEAIEKLGGRHVVSKFGASDCHCKSHLLYFGGLQKSNIQNSRKYGT